MNLNSNTNFLEFFSPEILISKYNVDPNFAFNPNLIYELYDLVKDVNLKEDSFDSNDNIQMSSHEELGGISQVKIYLTHDELTIIRYDPNENLEKKRINRIIREKRIKMGYQNNMETTMIHLIFQDTKEGPLTRRITITHNLCDEYGIYNSSKKLRIDEDKIQYDRDILNKTNLSYEELLSISNVHFPLALYNLSTNKTAVSPGSIEITRHQDYAEYAYLKTLYKGDEINMKIVPLFNKMFESGMLVRMDSDIILNGPELDYRNTPRISSTDIEYYIENETQPISEITKEAIRKRFLNGLSLK